MTGRRGGRGGEDGHFIADKALELDAGDSHGLLQVELSIDPGRVIFFRMFEYSSLLIIDHHAATSGSTASAPAANHDTSDPFDAADPHAEEVAADAPVSAVLFILRGRKKPWPSEGSYRISPPGTPFSGLRFRIEAVYQRTVEELWARPGSFWLVFTCLAVDANVETMRRVINEIDRLASLRLCALAFDLSDFQPDRCSRLEPATTGGYTGAAVVGVW